MAAVPHTQNLRTALARAIDPDVNEHRYLSKDLTMLAEVYKDEGALSAMRLGATLLRKWGLKAGHKDKKIPHQLRYNIGVIALSGDNIPAARRCFESVLSHQSKHHSSMAGLADCNFREGHFGEAESQIRRALEVSSDNKPYFFILLSSLFAGKKFEALSKEIAPSIDDILRKPKPTEADLTMLALFVTAAPPEELLNIYKRYTNNSFYNPDTTLSDVANRVQILQQIQNPIIDQPLTAQSELETLLLTGGNIISRRADAMISTFGGYDDWLSMHAGEAMCFQLKEALDADAQTGLFSRLRKPNSELDFHKK